jgi:hypothetical protein
LTQFLTRAPSKYLSTIRNRVLAGQDENIPAVNEESRVGLADEGIPHNFEHGQLVNKPNATVPDFAISKPVQMLRFDPLGTEKTKASPSW